MSQCVLSKLAEYNVGTLKPHSGTFRSPSTPMELNSIPAVHLLMLALDSQWTLNGGKGASPSHLALLKALTFEGSAMKQFMSQAGYHFLTWVMHKILHKPP